MEEQLQSIPMLVRVDEGHGRGTRRPSAARPDRAVRHGGALVPSILLAALVLLVGCPKPASAPSTAVASPPEWPIDLADEAAAALADLVGERGDFAEHAHIVPWPQREQLVELLDDFEFMGDERVRDELGGVWLVEGFQAVERDGKQWEATAWRIGQGGRSYLLLNAHKWPEEETDGFPFLGTLHHELFHLVDMALFPRFIDDLHEHVCVAEGGARRDGLEAWCAAVAGEAPSCRRLELMKLHFELPEQAALEAPCARQGMVAFSRAWTIDLEDFITGTAPANTFEDLAETLSIYYAWTRHGVLVDKRTSGGQPTSLASRQELICPMVEAVFEVAGLQEDCVAALRGAP